MTKNNRKYTTLNICLIKMKGASTGILPNQVKRNKEIKIQIAIPLLKIELFHLIQVNQLK